MGLPLNKVVLYIRVRLSLINFDGGTSVDDTRAVMNLRSQKTAEPAVASYRGSNFILDRTRLHLTVTGAKWQTES